MKNLQRRANGIYRLAHWRRQLFDVDRLALVGTTSMNHDSVLKIADGHPFLKGGGIYR
jgi:hypothetical protein